MKKLISVIVVMLTVLCCLTACNFTSNMSGMVAGEAQATPKIEDMLAAMAENRLEDAKTLMHPTAADQSSAPIAQMSDYLSGRKVADMQLTNISVNVSTGMSGKSRLENVSFQVNLDDGTTIHLAAAYLSDNNGDGFTSFQLVLGVV